jgi:DNA-directed RNA polymerase specialized sigma24 family protein
MDALARYLTQPGVYDARRSHPMEWLLAIARNEIRHRWRARKSRPRLDAIGLHADLDVRASATGAGAVEPVDPFDRAERARERDRRLRVLTDNPNELRCAQLKLRGASFAEQAEALGAAYLTLAEQRRLVNGLFDRICHKAKYRWGS